MTKKERSFVLYDWANSAYSVAITSAILPVFFADVAAKNLSEVNAQAYWGYANTIATIIIALIAPILGTIADYQGYKKKFFNLFLILGVISTAALAFVGEDAYILCLVIYIISTLGFVGSNMFYDAFLTDVTTEDRYDKVSTYGYAFGYIGSCIPFIVCIFLIMKADLFGMTTLFATQLSFILTAIWWYVFSIPFIKNVHQEHYIPIEPKPFRTSIIRLGKTLKKIKYYRNTVMFLLAYFFYIDGVHTIINMSTIYGKSIGLSSTTLMVALLAVQLIAFPCAILYGNLVKKFSTKPLLYFGIVVYMVITYIGYTMKTPLQFWIVAILVATQQGGIQAISRSAFSKLIPKENSAEFFGFFSIFGKFSAALGPFVVGTVSIVFDNTRLGILSLIFFFIIGIFFLSKVDFNSDEAKRTIH